MYIQKHFEITDQEEIFAFIKANAFGQLISQVDGRFFSTNIPFFVSDEQTKLIGHLAIQNPQWNQLEGQEVLVTFLGPHDYISPSWYKSPGVPTWNYQAVHVYGQGKVINDKERIKSIVHALTAKYELQQERPWKIEYAESMLDKIIGIEIEITEIQCKYKLSQNRSAEDQACVADQLESIGNFPIADAMDRNKTR